MADPTLQMNFTALRIRVAEYLGIAPLVSDIAGLPTDAHDLDLVGRMVNDGYRRFISENEKWNFLNVRHTIKFYSQQTGTITAVTGTTFTVGALAGTFANDVFNGYQVRLVDASTLDTYDLTITDYVGATGVFTVAAMPAAIAANDSVQYAGPNNVAGQANEYFMPDDFYGIVLAPYTYDANGPRVRMNQITEEEWREQTAMNQSSGTPAFFAHRPINTTATSTGGRYEVLFWPAPNSNERVTATYKRFPNALTAGTDSSVAGFQHDESILKAALAAAELYRDDRLGVNEQGYQQSLARSLRLDKRATPARNRPYGDKSDGPINRYGWYDGPDSVNGTAVR